jgi:hypothetical protein
MLDLSGRRGVAEHLGQDEDQIMHYIEMVGPGYLTGKRCSVSDCFTRTPVGFDTDLRHRSLWNELDALKLPLAVELHSGIAVAQLHHTDTLCRRARPSWHLGVRNYLHGA